MSTNTTAPETETLIRLEFDFHDTHCSLDVDAMLDELGTDTVALLDERLKGERAQWRAGTAKPAKSWEYDDLDFHLTLLREMLEGYYSRGVHHEGLPEDHPDYERLDEAREIIGSYVHSDGCACGEWAHESFVDYFNSVLSEETPDECHWAFYRSSYTEPVYISDEAPAIDQLVDQVPYARNSGWTHMKFTWDRETGRGEVWFDHGSSDLQFYVFGPGPRYDLVTRWLDNAGGYDNNSPAREVHEMSDTDVELFTALNESFIDLAPVDPVPTGDGSDGSYYPPAEKLFRSLEHEDAVKAAAPLLQADLAIKAAVIALAPNWDESIDDLLKMSQVVYA